MPVWLLRALPYIAGLALAWAAYAWAYNRGEADERAAHDETKREHAAVITRLAELTRTAAEKARAATAAVAAERADIAAAHEEELNDARAEADRLRADLRAGRRQLQDWWASPVPGPGAGDAAADGAEADAARRADSAARIAQAVSIDAAVIGKLWADWEADRRAVIAAGCAVEGR